jgi:hypothetical protein
MKNKKNKNLMLICPKFMGYDEMLLGAFGKYYNVFFLDNDRHLKRARSVYNANNYLIKGAYKALPALKEMYREDILNKIEKLEDSSYLDNIDMFEIVVAINGDGILNEFYHSIKKSNPKAKFYLYIWDDFSWLFKNSHVRYFDCIYSYNINDCKKHSFAYIPVFTKQHDIVSNEKIYDIAIIATANKARVKLTKRLYKKYKEKYKFYIYFYDPKGQFDFYSYPLPLSYDHYLHVMSESVSILDSGRNKQKGPTTRVFDSIKAHTKVISTNPNLSKYPVCQDNIHILDQRLTIPFDFIKNSYVINEQSDDLGVDNWIYRFLGSDVIHECEKDLIIR